MFNPALKKIKKIIAKVKIVYLESEIISQQPFTTDYNVTTDIFVTTSPDLTSYLTPKANEHDTIEQKQKMSTQILKR